MYRILIVDDEAAIRERLPLAFDWEQYGFEVAGTASNGEAARQKMPLLQPDLILLDIRMPVMDGLSFLRWLHDSEYRHTAVILLTGYSEFDYAITAMRYGARGYLTKPLDEDEIADYLLDIASDLHARKEEEEEAEVMSLADSTEAYIHAHYTENLTVASVAGALFVSPSHLGQTFRITKGVTFRQYLKTVRIRKAQQLLEHTGLHVYDIAHRVGFSESKYFVVCFEEETGMSPAAFRRARTGREEE